MGSSQEEQEDLVEVNLVEIREVGALTKCNKTCLFFELSHALNRECKSV